MGYQVRIRNFEGPFDLLLHLIAKRELDIYEVSLAAITEDYLAHLRQLEELDLEVATEFLVVAATLIEMKASRLLPGPPADDEEALALSERDLLIARLLQYRAFKEVSGRLKALMEANAGYVGRTAGPGEAFARIAPDLLARITLTDLRDIARAALAAKPVQRLDLSHIAPIRASVTEAIEELAGRLRERARWSFRDLTAHCRHRIEVVVRFLAVLELVKRGDADVVQSGSFGEIVVVRHEDAAGRPIVLEGSEFDDEAAGPDGEAPAAIDLTGAEAGAGAEPARRAAALGPGEDPGKDPVEGGAR